MKNNLRNLIKHTIIASALLFSFSSLALACNPEAVSMRIASSNTLPLNDNIVYRGTFKLTLPSDCSIISPYGILQLFDSEGNIVGDSANTNRTYFHNDRFYSTRETQVTREGTRTVTIYRNPQILKGKESLIGGAYYIGITLKYNAVIDGRSSFYEKEYSQRISIKTLGGNNPPSGEGDNENPTPTPAPNPIDREAPQLSVTGIPTDNVAKNNVKGVLSFFISASDDVAIKSVTVIGFNKTFIKTTNLGVQLYTKDFQINTNDYPDGVHNFSVTVRDNSNKIKTYNEVFTVRNGNTAPTTPTTPTVTPTPSTPTTPVVTPPSTEGGSFADLMNLLVQLLSNLMQVLANLNLDSSATTRSLASADSDATLMFVELIKTNKQELKRVTQTRKIPRLTKRFSKAYSNAKKTKREKKKAKLVAKSNRILNKILKNLK